MASVAEVEERLAVASMETDTESSSLRTESEGVPAHIRSRMRDDLPTPTEGSSMHTHPRRRQMRDPPASRLRNQARMDQRGRASIHAPSRHASSQIHSSPIVHVDSVQREEDASQSARAFVLVDAVDQPILSGGTEAMEPIQVTGSDAVHIDEEMTDIQNAVFANDASVAMATATLDRSAQEATVVSSTPSQAELTEELDEKIAAAMGRSLGLTVERLEEEAAVVGITEHDVHPADLAEGEVRATFIGEDYSRAVRVPDTPSSVSPTHEQEATVIEIAQNGPTTVSQNEEVAPSETPSISPAVASPVASSSREEEATVLKIEEDIHPDNFSPTDVAATLLERDSSRAPPPPPHRSPQRPMNVRSSSSPVTASYHNPFQDDSEDTPALSRAGLAALDEAEERAWLNHPPLASPNVPPILPPQVPRSASDPSPIEAEPLSNSSSVGLEAPSQERRSTLEPPAPLPRQRPPPRPMAERSVSEPSETCHPRGNRIPTRSPSVERTSNGSGANNSSTNPWGGTQRLHRLSNMALRSTKDAMDMFLGDPTSRKRNGRKEPLSPAECIMPRTLLPWSVFHNETTNMWIATVNTNQKALDSKNVEEASRALKAFSLPTQRSAEEVGLAMAPPRMLPFDTNPLCHICQGKFSVFRRACHCRNCGVCVCSSCSTARPSKMIPTTYNIKNESTVNICRSCDWLSSAFRIALLEGQRDEALALYSTGNINVESPFANVKGELLFPVHCAVMGGNLDLVKWLIDDRCCPIRYMRNRDLAKKKGVPLPLLTSKGRSLLGLALTDKRVATEHKVDIIHYLTVEKNMSLFDEKDLNMYTALVALTAVLNQLPRETGQDMSTSVALNEAAIIHGPENGVDESMNDAALAALAGMEREDDAAATSADDCIICYDNPIDSVLTPCGHQICCMQCSKNISSCPVCSVPCSFIRVYKA